MDYCAGGEFYRTIQMQPHKCLTEEQMRFYAAEVLLALEYLHAMGFVYRDLKPENILLHASGHIRLTDFDLSKASVTPVNAHVVQSMMGGPTMVAEPTLVTNSFVGTEEYLAPEVIVGKGYGASVDWWTFGILMYEMLYGVTPFRGKSQPDTFHRIEKTQVKFPEHARGPVSKECKSLIKKLLTHDPKKRLGYEQGAAEIKAHPFFKDVNLQLILNSKPPIIPELSGPNDFRYFSSRIVDDDKDDEDMEFVNPDELDEDHPFKSFVPVDREADSKAKAAAAAAAASKPFKKSSHSSSSAAGGSSSSTSASQSSKRKTTSNASSSSLTVDSPSETGRKSKTHSRKNSGESSHTTVSTNTSSAHKSTSRISSDDDDGGHHHSARQSSRHQHDATTSSESENGHGRDSPANGGGQHHSSNKHDSVGSASDEEGTPQIRVPQPVRRKKTPTLVSAASSEPATVPKSRPRPPEEDDGSEEEVKMKVSSKVPRSRTPHPDEDTYAASPKTKHSSRHHAADAAAEDDPQPTKLKKSTLGVKAEKDHHGSHSGTSSATHSRHSSSKRSTTPEHGDDDGSSTASSRSKEDKSESKHERHDSKSMKKVPSNLSEELEGVAISKSSSKRAMALAEEESTSTRSSRRGTPTTSKKHSSTALATAND
jgi:serine/threonine protein kinase